ncbi:hypothetical protein SOVF_077640 [Spinacia oleracea]|uniref:2-hydroxyflavanone C-glucosyltransferase n=1 Tax=Spinacia oleracea TaxID=3562 RepID=A0A9R0HWB9_SPIOL|nr:zeatin O-xylosyltransferase-like [Spinacia oleracea]KNA17683.1 hypothetical protein SOVF_077640 [Spinacia oleracea]
MDSVIYVLFGTTTSMTEEQIRELVDGLERRKHKFVWVLRDADKVDILKEDGSPKGHDVPEGYKVRVKGLGLVLKDWAPLLEILGHPTTGGFISHCRWNSCLESLSMRVPIITWPIYSDQPKNSMLVTKVLRIGVVVKDWAHRDELITSNVVESAIRRLSASNEGEGIRKRERKLGDAGRKSAAKGGTSCIELDSFVSHITR